MVEVVRGGKVSGREVKGLARGRKVSVSEGW